jgi:deoxyribodipyrimidine photo-lyase
VSSCSSMQSLLTLIIATTVAATATTANSNWGNWHAIAGLAGGRLNRFNTLKQSKQYDPEGDYLRYWLPVLGKLPVEYVHEPHRAPAAVQAEAGCIVDGDYPEPLPCVPFSAVYPGANERHKRQGGKGSSKGDKALSGSGGKRSRAV